MSVNISARNLLQPDFADDVRRALHEAGVAPCDLCLEVTETSIMADPRRAIVTLGRLRDLGVEIAVDDFGTGHSSLAYLKDLPVNEVKIDKSFVFPMLTSRRDEAIVRSIVDLARNLDLRIVAEGVEDADVLDRLRELGCHLTQGYHHARPLPPDAFEELLRTDAAAALAVW
jgi:EAL domain-containing protein (putative c-di-GMP-specific phosphodiesterase class I)